MSFRIIAAFVIFIFGMRVNGQTVTPSEPLSKTLTIFDLPPFERAVCCIRFYEGLHRKKDYPYVGYGHRLRPGERYSSEMTASEAEALLRKDLKELCSLFRPYGKDSLLLAALAYNIGVFKLLGLDGKYPKSIILKKLDSGDRNIKNDYVQYCHWRGKKIASIERRRYAEFLLLFDS
ncbi:MULTISPECIES: glycoside hydrolase family protein [Bacteroides]|uniref:glycoside hydrolase family protein n=1 Tax=Bacteroides TaxID=816 RepID=UPI00094B2B7A|nr:MULTISPECIES: lysozyme [Bacteroides]MCF2551091.1 lysozyme [Bacteroides caecigallinarum]